MLLAVGIYQHHLDTYGGPKQFGYREFVLRFKAERFDAGQWAEVIARSGAKYAGTMGPKRDIYGELVRALREKELRVIATSTSEHSTGSCPRRSRTWRKPGPFAYAFRVELKGKGEQIHE